MTIRIAAAWALVLWAGGGFGIASTMIRFEIVDAVNAKLPENEKFEPLGWYPTKTLRLFHEYRRLCPGGPLLQREGLTVAGGNR